MSALISALDNFTPSQLGENGSVEYTWSNSIRERIIQLSFQLTRTRHSTSLKDKTDKIMKDIAQQYKATGNREQYVEYMSIMYRMIAHTRDIVDGKGEYALAYMLLDVWNKHHPELAQFALKLFVLPPDGKSVNYHPYGSWKDIKYIYNNDKSSSLAKYGTDLIIEQLRQDETAESPSLVAKWVPRENSRFGELFNELAVKYFSNYIDSVKKQASKDKAILKAKTHFRKLVSKLNKQLDTVQIKQCGLNWREIDPAKQTSITMHKQKNAFLNISKKGEQRHNDVDRIICADKFTAFAKEASEGKVEVKGKRVGLNDFTQEALTLISYKRQTSTEAMLLNAQWLNNSQQTGSLGKMVAMVDVSGSMSGDPMNAAIALGIRVAEKSILGKRVLTFSETPSWVNLDGKDNFVDMVDIVSHANWGMNTNFASALKLILDAAVINKLTPEDMEDMVLAIFSDMQIDKAEKNGGYGWSTVDKNPSSKSLMNSIEEEYAQTGMSIWGRPFKAPHILFWNLRSTSGFPTLSTQNNASMMSGFSPALLNLFCDEGLEALKNCTPWQMFIKGLENERYSPLDVKLRETL